MNRIIRRKFNGTLREAAALLSLNHGETNKVMQELANKLQTMPPENENEENEAFVLNLLKAFDHYKLYGEDLLRFYQGPCSQSTENLAAFTVIFKHPKRFPMARKEFKSYFAGENSDFNFNELFSAAKESFPEWFNNEPIGAEGLGKLKEKFNR